MREYKELGFIQVEIVVPMYFVHKNYHMANRDPGMLLDGRLGLLSKFPSVSMAFRVIANSGELEPREGSPTQKNTKRNQEVTKNQS